MADKYYVFLTKEFNNADVEKVLFGKILEKHPCILNGYRYGEYSNSVFYLQKDSKSSVEGYAAVVTAEQLWLLDQWNEVPVLNRILITADLFGKSISLYLYIENLEAEKLSGNQSTPLEKALLLKEKFNADTMGACDLHLMYPCSFHNYPYTKSNNVYASIVSEDPYYEESQEELSQFELSRYFISKLKANNNSEFNDSFIRDIERQSWGIVECSFIYDGKEYIEYGFAYVSIHESTKVGLFSIVFPAINNPVLLQMFAFCSNMLRIKNEDESFEISDWLKAKGITLYGFPKGIVFCYSDVKKVDILKCLACEMEPIGSICSKTLKEWSEDNFAQYDIAEVYASDKCMIEICKCFEHDVIKRLKNQAYEIFLIEVLLFQEAAIARVCARVSSYLNNTPANANSKKMSAQLYDLSNEMSTAIIFMDHKRFLYPSVRISSEKIAQRFGTYEEIEKYYKYREILEQKINLNIADQEKIESATMNILLLFLTMIQVVPVLKDILSLIYSNGIILKIHTI